MKISKKFVSKKRNHECRKELKSDIKEFKRSRHKQLIVIRIWTICASLGFLFNVAILIYCLYSGEIY